MSADTDPYDLLAPHYEEIARGRAAYLAGVDRLVLAAMPTGARALLDVGAGDGRRAERLAAAAGIERLVLAEPSRAMAAACAARRAAEVWRVRAQDLPDAPPFDVVTCLWNVLGHVATADERVAALRRMRALLAPHGVLVLDVNHRCNARAYGLVRTFGRAALDLLRPSPANGDVAFTWRVADLELPARGHVFRTREVVRLVRAAELRVRRRHVVDYATGEERRLAWSGQLVYVLGR